MKFFVFSDGSIVNLEHCRTIKFIENSDFNRIRIIYADGSATEFKYKNYTSLERERRSLLSAMDIAYDKKSYFWNTGV